MCSLGPLLKYLLWPPSGLLKVGANHYELQKELYRNTLYTNVKVYLGIESNTRASYAIKIVKVDNTNRNNFVMYEIELMKKFAEHPHVLSLIDSDVHNMPDNTQEVILLMKYYPKGTLQTLVEKMETEDTYLPEDTLFNVFLGICAAVRELHRQRPPLIHCSITPQNIFLDEHYHPVLSGLGSVISTSFDELHQLKLKHFCQRLDAVSCPMHTLSYSAPETFEIKEGHLPTTSIDIWSLGCVMFDAAHHANPFELETKKGGNLKMSIKNGHYSFPDEALYSDSLNGFIKKMIVVDPSSRPNIEEVIHTAEKLWNLTSEPF